MTNDQSPLAQAARILNATPADLPGLWNAPGYPELTDWQLIHAASSRPALSGLPIGGGWLQIMFG